MDRSIKEEIDKIDEPMCEFFEYARPVWVSGKEMTSNLMMALFFDIQAKPASEYKLKITGSTLYRVILNHQLIYYGPARAGHGFFRVDEVFLPVNPGENTLLIEVAGYNCPSYYTLNYKSFLCAEILCDRVVENYTCYDSKARIITERDSKSIRYSLQRAFTEIWSLDHHKEIQYDSPLAEIDVDWGFIPREVPYPVFRSGTNANMISRGRYSRDNNATVKKFWYMKEAIPGDDAFYDLQRLRFTKVCEVECTNQADFLVKSGEYVVLKLPINNNGFISASITAKEDSELWFVFDEMLTGDIVDGLRLNCINILQYNLKKSAKPYNILSFESYGYQYIMCVVRKGFIAIHHIGIVEYGYPVYKNTSLECDDKELVEIFSAAVETYRQNTMDVFMDCPTRERAGWLCDSYFTAQSAQLFSGDCSVEKVFLENYIMAKHFPGIPEGMLPMCYPAESYKGTFIPQWALWYIVELYEYLGRNGSETSQRFKQICYGLLGWMERYRNSDGLLENLPGWNFIEWSKANEWVRDINYPTNMLYKRALELVGLIYNDTALIRQAEKIKNQIIEQSYNGSFFIDNAVRDKDKILRNTENISEVCQYYAFFFKVADSENPQFSSLKKTVLNKLGPHQSISGLSYQVAPANAFIGYYLRLSLLLKWRKYTQAVKECKEYFLKMAKTTGTLWEHGNANASLNHGFASFAGVVIVKSLTGVVDINTRERLIKIDKEHCTEASISVDIGCDNEVINISREASGAATDYKFPEGYQVIYI
ncbi:MAG TPA: hypothetical protein GXX75_21350 [Clostridiales bacterium]|nr:hypothetical protein [Clostridiales bacterium]